MDAEQSPNLSPTGANQTASPVPQNKLQLIILVVVSVLFVLSAVWGIFSGLAYGRSQINYQHVNEIYGALGSFYKDEGKYPTQTQFYDQRILVVQGYLNTLPQPARPSGACKAYPNFDYSQKTLQDYSLVFCLEQSVGGLSAGAHNLTNQGMQ